MAHDLHAMNRWSKFGVLDRVFAKMQQARIVRIKIESVALASTIVKVHPDGTGALRRRPQSIGKSRGGWTTKTHMVAAHARTAITFCLSPGQVHDALEGCKLLTVLGGSNPPMHMIMVRVYEGDETQQLVFDSLTAVGSVMPTTVTAGVAILMGRKSILGFCGIPIDDPTARRDTFHHMNLEELRQAERIACRRADLLRRH